MQVVNCEGRVSRFFSFFPGAPLGEKLVKYFTRKFVRCSATVYPRAQMNVVWCVGGILVLRLIAIRLALPAFEEKKTTS
jgi:hypothetical protein